MSDITDIQKRLLALRDDKNAQFLRKLLPTVDPDTILGARTPDMRALARTLAAEGDQSAFLRALPHRYYEENGLHVALLNRCKDFNACLKAIEDFLPYIDNWAVCDTLRPGVFKKEPQALYEKCKLWLRSERPYTIRYGIGILTSFYLDEHFSPEHLSLVADLRSEEYYVNMMIAWYFATALAKQYEATIPYLQKPRLERWTHNKAIQKAVESRRITDEQKTYLKTLKVKG